jgi:cytochrome c
MPRDRQEEDRSVLQGHRQEVKGKADAEDKLNTHLTTSPMVEVDGNKEQHKSIKTKDAPELKNVIQWILSQ